MIDLGNFMAGQFRSVSIQQRKASREHSESYLSMFEYSRCQIKRKAQKEARRVDLDFVFRCIVHAQAHTHTNIYNIHLHYATCHRIVSRSLLPRTVFSAIVRHVNAQYASVSMYSGHENRILHFLFSFDVSTMQCASYGTEKTCIFQKNLSLRLSFRT